jgi:hypothetical protein
MSSVCVVPGRRLHTADADEVRKGTCHRCGKKPRRLVLRCTREREQSRQYSWVCIRCSDELTAAEVARAERVRQVVDAVGASEQRAISREIRERLFHGSW